MWKEYPKIPKISPSKYKPHKLVTQKTLRYIAPPNISPPPTPPGLVLGNSALKYKVKQSKNGKFPFNYKLAQSIRNANFPPYISPSEYKPLIFGILR